MLWEAGSVRSVCCRWCGTVLEYEDVPGLCVLLEQHNQDCTVPPAAPGEFPVWCDLCERNVGTVFRLEDEPRMVALHFQTVHLEDVRSNNGGRA